MLNKQTRFDRNVLIVNRVLIGLLVFITIVPLAYVLAASFQDPDTLMSQGISFNLKNWTLAGYQKVLANDSILRGFVNSMFYSFAYAAFSTIITMLCAYPLSKKEFVGRKVIMSFFLLTMFFGGGLVPTYMVVKNLGILDTPWAIILPGAINIWNIILARTYFQSLPDELEEAAKIDGANSMQVFFKILLPLAKPIMFVLFLYAFVGQWNSYFDAMIYIKDPDLQPLQLILRNILIQNQIDTNMVGSQAAMAEMEKVAQLIKYATIIISSLPLIIMYPFFQKYFDKGVLVGSMKG
ncbi:MAG: carbohydrate ABC transporter permease [Carnobacterium sp.]|jgi:putative aldouronate transport system permease protein|uniref:Binding--dependent transport system inner membrane component family protein n=1 Tax=Carnobacterium maltaromaticum LMA28 TaxID=1234679 RepID=K8EWA3_CARML|nr:MULTISPECIES: carbohydrate ABC transporter permease [Carnobacterium]AOA03430.1 sugar ABC transporter permease [Carnobacterium maltaromaticum]MBC9788101.1 ABC transporter permease subunit [Carnobacterium maltaromaticum]MBC9809808.1 ABC transporter permease subunit [Carnobacterium maltaromaticum]MBQ6485368.1 carbohydrate ABC transporter permease [Carnobacterium sp.]MCC4313330.1 sugar ABC transporter permease [Carnobacterium maltaromaticum]